MRYGSNYNNFPNQQQSQSLQNSGSNTTDTAPNKRAVPAKCKSCNLDLMDRVQWYHSHSQCCEKHQLYLSSGQKYGDKILLWLKEHNINEVIIQTHQWINKLLENRVLEHCSKLDRWQGPPHRKRKTVWNCVVSAFIQPWKWWRWRSLSAD